MKYLKKTWGICTRQVGKSPRLCSKSVDIFLWILVVVSSASLELEVFTFTFSSCLISKESQ